MKSLVKRSFAPFWLLVATALFMIAGAVVVLSHVSRADDGNTTKDGRLITIHDRGSEKVIITAATTVGDALKEAGINLDTKDTVEPAADQKLIASDYQVNIYRARPVVVIDGNVRQKIITPYQTTTQIVKDAGITVYPEDILTLSRTDNILSEGAGLKLTIDRATPFEFTLYGKTLTARTQGNTVGQMLSEKGINLGKSDRVSTSESTPITPGMTVRVWREGKQTVTVDEEVAFEVEKISDTDQPVGYRLVRTAGQLGSRSVTYAIEIQDGKEVARTEIASITTKESTKQIEVVGAKGQYTTPSENENITWDYLMSHGYTRNQTAGIMGNLMQEHHFNTSGDGLAQWTGGRKAELMSRPSPNNIYTQLDFLMYELNVKYSGTRDRIKASDTVEGAVRIFQNEFERCGVCAEGQRIQYAYNILASH